MFYFNDVNLYQLYHQGSLKGIRLLFLGPEDPESTFRVFSLFFIIVLLSCDAMFGSNRCQQATRHSLTAKEKLRVQHLVSHI